MKQEIMAVIDDCEGFIADADDAYSLPRPAAEFVYALLRATGGKRALEIGTSYGYSGLWIGAALQENGGALTTVDREARKRSIAQNYFKRAGLGEIIECETGLALDILPALPGPFDFVLIDADKENCWAYGEAILPKMAPRGVILTDNTISHAEQLAEFSAWARSHEWLRSVEIPIGNGMEMSVRI